MTLEDVFQPNKFGTIPMLIIPGVGYGVLADGYIKVTALEGKLFECTILPLDTAVTVKGDVIRIEHSLLGSFYYYIDYLVPLTAEQYLINRAVDPIRKVLITTNQSAFTRSFEPEMLENMLDDGTGWIQHGDETVPVTFYVEDILYRLDLQGKLT